MARSVQDLELCTRSVLDMIESSRLHRTEANLLPLPYRKTEIPSKLRIGYFVEGMQIHNLSVALDLANVLHRWLHSHVTRLRESRFDDSKGNESRWSHMRTYTNARA